CLSKHCTSRKPDKHRAFSMISAVCSVNDKIHLFICCITPKGASAAALFLIQFDATNLRINSETAKEI
ncbi:MAG: hypothetical protein ACI4T5_03340, partial [Prevotella sp.]